MKTLTNDGQPWEYIKPAPLNTKMLLLTKDNQCVVGVWKGEPMPRNKTYKAWQGMPPRQRDIEQQLGYL